MIDEKPGAALNRDIARGEATEKELDRLITRRHDARVSSEGERQAEEMWQESERKYAERRREANRQAWASFHEEQAERHRATLQALVEHHEIQAAKLCEGEGVGFELQ
jgi:hypothetical protein